MSEKPPESSPEHRTKARRKQVLLQGVISWEPGAVALDCSVFDISPQGARITLQRDCALPDEFFLINIKDRCAYEARVAWRKARDVGLHLGPVLALSNISGPERAFLKTVWHRTATR